MTLRITRQGTVTQEAMMVLIVAAMAGSSEVGCNIISQLPSGALT